MKGRSVRAAVPAFGLALAAIATGPVLATGTASSAATPAAATPAASPARVSGPWMNTDLSAKRRARLLVAAMTLDEKIAEVHGAGYRLFSDPNATYAGIVPANDRLGIPAIYLADSPVGVGSNSHGVTQFADTQALASTWDTRMARKFGKAYGAEQGGKGNNIALGPTINILRLPTWGRAPETYSEDPYLTAHQAVRVIKGIQSQHVIATAKHFAANNQEYQRSSINVVVGRKARKEIYEPAFKASVKAGAGAVMCSYNRVGGTYACENADLLVDTLRKAWKFDGMVMSDWGALHSTVRAAKSGLDIEMPGVANDDDLSPIDKLFGGPFFSSRLKEAVQSGAVERSELDLMVRHVLTAMFRVGLFDHPTPAPLSVKDTVVSTPAHRALSNRIAERGTVLLKNAHRTLPLSGDKVGSLAVIGDAAENPLTFVGGSGVVTASAPVVTPLAGITARAGSDISVSHAPGTLGTDALPAVPASAFPGGLTATYFGTADLSGAPIATETVDDLDFDGTPSAVGSATTWSARYTGTIDAPAAGTYRFSLQAGAFVTVYVDDEPVVSYQPFFESVRNGLVDLTAGAHDIRVEVTPFQDELVTVDVFAVSPRLHLGWQPQEEQLVAEAAATAEAADVAVVVASAPSSEGTDRSTLALPADQNRLISAVAAANPRTVVVLNTSSAVSMPWLSKVAAVVEVWFPGQTAGTALGRVLFGDVNPSGKLPVTFPRNDRQGPARSRIEYPGDGTDVFYKEGTLVGYRWFDAKRQRPLFPFGYGLSYTSFDFSGLQVHQKGRRYVVHARVTNTGSRAGSEVAQLYVRFPKSAHEPVRQLKAYDKVHLGAGESTRVTLRLPRRALAAWNTDERGWRIADGNYRLYVGDSSRHLPLRTTIRR